MNSANDQKADLPVIKVKVLSGEPSSASALAMHTVACFHENAPGRSTRDVCLYDSKTYRKSNKLEI